MAYYAFDVYDRAAPNGARLVRLTTSATVKLQGRKVLHGTGAGAIQIHSTHADATATNFKTHNLVKVVLVRDDLSEKKIYGWFMEEGDFTAVSRKEQAGRMLTFKGPGTLFIGDRAVLRPDIYAPGQTGRGTEPLDGDFIWRWNGDDVAGSIEFGSILTRVWEEGVYEPETPLAAVTLTFNRTTDSNSVVWPNMTGSFELPIGTTILEATQRLIRLGITVQMSADLVLSAYQTFGTDRTSTSYAAGKVRFLANAATANVLNELRRQIQASVERSRLIGIGQDGIWGTVGGGSSPVPYYDVVNVESNDGFVILEALDRNLAARQKQSDAAFPVRHVVKNDPLNGGYLAGDHYDVGDLVTAHTGTGAHDFNNQALEVAAFSLEHDDAGNWFGIPELGGQYLAIGGGVEEQIATGIRQPGSHTHLPNPPLCSPGTTPTPPPLLGAPVVAATANNSETVATTTHNLALPSGIAAGHLLLAQCVFGPSSGAVTGWPAGWKVLLDEAGTGIRKCVVAAKIATGGETSFDLTTANAVVSHQHVQRITGAAAIPALSWINQPGTADPDPPIRAFAWTTPQDTLWIAGFGGERDADAYPTSYSLYQYTATPGAGVGMGTASRSLQAATEDPSSFSTTDGNPHNYVAWTMAVPSVNTAPLIPTVAHIGNSQQVAATTTHAVVLPGVAGAAGESVAEAGDLFVLVFTCKDAPTVSGWPGGWEVKIEATAPASDHKLIVAARTAIGSDAGFNLTTSASVESTARVHRVLGLSGLSVVASGSATDTSTTPDPPSVTQGATGDVLWIAACVSGSQPTAYPSSYTLDQWNEHTSGAGGTGVGVATRRLTTATENPGTFTTGASDNWAAATLAIAANPVAGDTPNPLAQDGGATMNPDDSKCAAPGSHKHEHGNITGTSPKHTAQAIAVVDTAGHYAATETEGALAEVKSDLQARSWKQPVRVATTAAGTLASSFENGDTVDGVVLATGDRLLIKDQATGSENGIYTINASGAPTRATDMDASAEVLGAAVLVMEGTANADKFFRCTTNAPITLGTTTLTFSELSSAALTVKEADGSPSVSSVTTIKVGNGDLTDEGSGIVRIKTAADAGGGTGNVVATPSSSTITIPGLALGDRKPASPGAYDEEFDGTADTLPTNWAWTSAPSGSDAWYLNSRWPSLLSVEGSGNTTYTLSRTSFSAAATFGIFAKVHIGALIASDASALRLYVYNSGSTEGRGVNWRATGSRAAGLRALKMVASTESVWGTEMTGMVVAGGTMYIGITRDGSNNLTAWYSRDGVAWDRLAAAEAHTFTIDRFVFTFRTPSLTTLVGVDWVRYRTDNDFPRP